VFGISFCFFLVAGQINQIQGIDISANGQSQFDGLESGEVSRLHCLLSIIFGDANTDPISFVFDGQGAASRLADLGIAVEAIFQQQWDRSTGQDSD
jgi:hypothetical protein